MSRRHYYRLSALQAKAAHRPPGYLNRILGHCEVIGDRVYIRPAAHDTLRAKYQTRGLGDRLTRLLHWFIPLLPARLQLLLLTCQPCLRRRTRLNHLTAALRRILGRPSAATPPRPRITSACNRCLGKPS